MTQYIDKAAVVAEIKKRINYYQTKNQKWGVAGYAGRVAEGEEILDYINTLEVKEVDLKDGYMVDREIAREKSILDETKVEYFATGKPTIAAYSKDNLRNQFDAGSDWMKEQIIKALR